MSHCNSLSAASGGSRWDLRELYASAAQWAEAHTQLLTAIHEIATLQGCLTQGAAALFSVLELESKLRRRAGRVCTYAELSADRDSRDVAHQERLVQANMLQQALNTNTRWIQNEIAALGQELISDYMAQHAGLRERYGLTLQRFLRRPAQTRAAAGSLQIAESQSRQTLVIWSRLVDCELPYPSVQLTNGASVPANRSHYRRLQESGNAADQKTVTMAFLRTLQQFEQTLGSILIAKIMADAAAAQAAGFSRTFEHALSADEMPKAAYTTLLEETQAGLPVLRQYLALRRRALQPRAGLGRPTTLESLLAGTCGEFRSLDEATRVMVRALSPLGPRYGEQLRAALSERWMDTEVTDGKVCGAYANTDAYDVHPFILLNFCGTYASCQSLVHEWGHAMHSWIASQAQPFPLFQPQRCVGESMAILNQRLLNAYLLEQAQTPAQRLRCIFFELEAIRKVFFRQVMLAEFEDAAHRLVKNQAAVSGGRLAALYADCLQRYAQDLSADADVLALLRHEWAQVPHLYCRYYLYQYAVAFAVASNLAQRLRNADQGLHQRLLRMMGRGGSALPCDLFASIDIDIAHPAIYRAMMARMSELMAEFADLTEVCA